MRSTTVGLARTLPLAAEAVSVWLRHQFVEPWLARPSLPRALLFISTHRCNARCVMCGIWKQKPRRADELSIEQLNQFLADRLCSRLEYVSINGGEPFLRDDLPEIARTVFTQCSRLKRLSVTTNGLLTERMRTMLSSITDDASRRGVLVDVSVSVHAIGEALSEVYGVDRAFEKTVATMKLLSDLRDQGRLSFSVNCVLLSSTLAGARSLKRWAEEQAISMTFVVGEQRERFRTDGLDDVFVDDAERGEMIEFLAELAEDCSQPPMATWKYRELVEILEGRKERTLSCHYAMGGVLLGFDGKIFYCPHSEAIGDCLERSPYEIYYGQENLQYRREALFRAECRRCPPYTRTRWEIEKDLPRALVEMARRKVSSGR